MMGFNETPGLGLDGQARDKFSTLGLDFFRALDWVGLKVHVAARVTPKAGPLSIRL